MTSDLPQVHQRGLRPVDVPDVFVPAPRFPWTGVATVVLTLATVIIPLGLTALSATFTLLMFVMFMPLSLVGAAVTIAFLSAAITKLTFGIVVCVYSFKGKQAAPKLGIAFAVFSFFALGLMLQLLFQNRMTPSWKELPLDETFAYLVTCLGLTMVLIVAAARDLARSSRFQLLFRLGDRLTYADLERAGLVDKLPEFESDERELEFHNGEPTAYGSHRRS